MPFIPGSRRSGTTPPTRSCGSSSCPAGSGSSAAGSSPPSSPTSSRSLGVEVTLVARSELLLRHEDTDIAERYTELALEPVRRPPRPRDDPGDATGRRTIALRMLTRDGADERRGRRAPGRRRADAELGPCWTWSHRRRGRRGRARGGRRVPADQCRRASTRSATSTAPHQLKHVANHEARVVKHNLLHPDDRIEADHRYVPHAVFSSPQVAAVGLTEQEAIEPRHPVCRRRRGVRRHRLRLGDGGHHRLRQDPRRSRRPACCSAAT